MPFRFLNTPQPFLPAPLSVPSGYTQRMLVTGRTSNSTPVRAMTTYMSSVSLIEVGGTYVHVLSDANPRLDNKGLDPYQLVHIYTTSFSSPDGDLPYKHGDYFFPAGNVVGLFNTTACPIRGVQAYPQYIELLVEQKL